jgi:hypothetical protein
MNRERLKTKPARLPKAQADNAYAFNCLLKFFQMQRERIDHFAVSTGRNMLL